jgi:hypothetical protein
MSVQLKRTPSASLGGHRGKALLNNSPDKIARLRALRLRQRALRAHIHVLVRTAQLRQRTESSVCLTFIATVLCQSLCDGLHSLREDCCAAE